MRMTSQEFREFWVSRGIPAPRSGASEASIAAFEQERGVMLPPDFRQFFELMDGADDSATAGALTFWPLSELRPIPEVMNGTSNPCMDLRVPTSLPGFEGYYVFADFLIWSNFYAISLAPGTEGAVVFVHGTDWFRVGSSFSEFLHSYSQEASSPHFSGYLPELA